MNRIDLLLKLDKEKLVRPVKEVEIKRLSEIAGEPFIITCQALTPDEFEEIQNGVSITKEGEVDAEKNLKEKYIVKGVKDPDFNNLQVVEYYGATNGAEAVANIFLPGEITGLFNVINELSGFSKNAITEIKNSSTQTQK